MNQKELNDVLSKHTKWLNNETGGKRADLYYTDKRCCVEEGEQR